MLLSLSNRDVNISFYFTISLNITLSWGSRCMKLIFSVENLGCLFCVIWENGCTCLHFFLSWYAFHVLRMILEKIPLQFLSAVPGGTFILYLRVGCPIEIVSNLTHIIKFNCLFPLYPFWIYFLVLECKNNQHLS